MGPQVSLFDTDLFIGAHPKEEKEGHSIGRQDGLGEKVTSNLPIAC